MTNLSNYPFVWGNAFCKIPILQFADIPDTITGFESDLNPVKVKMQILGRGVIEAPPETKSIAQLATLLLGPPSEIPVTRMIFENEYPSEDWKYRDFFISKSSLSTLACQSQPRPGQLFELNDVIRIFTTYVAQDLEIRGQLRINHLGPSVLLFRRQIVNASQLSRLGGSHTNHFSDMKSEKCSFYFRKEVNP